MASLREQLLSGEKPVGVIGLGYIGLNTALYFARQGIRSIGVDIDPVKVQSINQGDLPIDQLRYWLTFNTESLLDEFVEATEHIEDLAEAPAVFVAVPTEKDGAPWQGALADVVQEVAKFDPQPLVVIESTLAPAVADEYVSPYIEHFAICPRRDWFGEPQHDLRRVVRIVGGNTGEATEAAIDILSIICDHLVPCNYREAALTKAVENAMRHLHVVYAQQLALAYPNVDVRRVLELAGTKFNIETYFPSALGSGGYCVPLASRYVHEAAVEKEPLSLNRAAIATDDSMASIVADALRKRSISRLGILGIAYTGNLKVHILSGALRLLNEFSEGEKLGIRVNDPLYSDEELRDLTGCEPFKFLDELDEFDALILTAGHDQYRAISQSLLVSKTHRMKFILDNTALWEGIPFECPLIVPGRAGWLDQLFRQSEIPPHSGTSEWSTL